LGLFIFLTIIFSSGCFIKKKGKKTSLMKNITAHYNIYFNASELLHESELNIRNLHKDDFNQVLDIYPLPTEAASSAEAENLKEVVTKANRIALEKFESRWVDDAFLLLAKSEYLKGNYYNAIEYFGYVGSNFPEEKKNTIEGLLWQGKSYFAIENYELADSILKNAYHKNLKHHRAKLNAALAQSHLYHEDIDSAIFHLKKAVNFTKNRYEKTRWTFILAQLQEKNNQLKDAYANYAKVVKSNAAFEMSFNANLARIKLEENASGKDFNKIATLKRLLKEDKNREFKDQIYYQIANTFLQQGDLGQAQEYYQISAHTIPGSQKQRGLSYLKLAEINFDSLKNYTQAQLYYDSTLQSLPREYPGYQNIVIKANNLQYLAQRLTLIEKEQELLMLSTLTQEAREAYINEKMKTKVEKEAVKKEESNNQTFVSIPQASASNKNAGAFYFNNPLAMSQGMSDFKKRWGNRKLQDNWRISGSSSANNNVASLANNLGGINNNLATQAESIDSLKADFLNTIPLTNEKRATSLNKIKTARYEIALFYKDVLDDKIASIEALELLVKDYNPQDEKLAEIYYQLYRIYEKINIQQSNKYKALLVENFPQSIYARAIINPNFNKNDQAAVDALRLKYEEIYALYQQKKYTETVNKIDALTATVNNYPNLAPKFHYLKTMALGYAEKPQSFVDQLQKIIKDYPSDSTIIPTIKAQLAYINENKTNFYSRPTALLAYHPSDKKENTSTNQVQLYIPKAEEDEKVATVLVKPEAKAETTKNIPVKEEKPIVKEEKTVAKVEPKPIVSSEKTANKEEIKTTKPISENTAIKEEVTATKAVPEKPAVIVFTNNSRVKHVIIINIKNAKINVAKPFAELTKYFYSKFDPSIVNLTIRTIGTTDKLIAIRAQLNNKDLAEKALSDLEKELPSILNLPANDYRKFVISESNLLLIKDTESLNQYLNYIK
jgi:tetratricopeptide (TPR) repeat protein